MKCSNCEQEMPPGDRALEVVVVRSGFDLAEGPSLACICEECQKTVLVMKIVLKRENVKDEFKFEQYLPIECTK